MIPVEYNEKIPSVYAFIGPTECIAQRALGLVSSAELDSMGVRSVALELPSANKIIEITDRYEQLLDSYNLSKKYPIPYLHIRELNMGEGWKPTGWAKAISVPRNTYDVTPNTLKSDLFTHLLEVPLSALYKLGGDLLEGKVIPHHEYLAIILSI